MLKICPCLNKSPLTLAHLLTVNRQKTVNKKLVCRPVTCTHQHRRKKQRMKIHYILTNKVVKLIFAAVPHPLKVQPPAIAVILHRSHITYRRIKPHIKVFIILTWYLKTEIRPIPRYIPVPQTRTKPLIEFIRSAFLCITACDKLFQLLFIIFKPEKIMHTLLTNRRSRTSRTPRILQIRRLISTATNITAVAVLILRPAPRTPASYKPVRQKHLTFRTIRLLNLLLNYRTPLIELCKYILTQPAILF